MARSLDRPVRFTRPGNWILNMLLFLTMVGAVVYYLSPWSPQPTTLLVDAFDANPALNGLILGVLIYSIAHNLNQTGHLGGVMRWVENFNRSPAARGSRGKDAPSLIRALENQLYDQGKKVDRLSAEATRAILDSVGTRLDERREFRRYLINLLVFLGLLGTFWGLLETVNAVAATINGLAVTTGAAEDAVSQLIQNLREPLSGMGTAFSSSLFGLGGSLIVGFLDLQTSEAQNQFYSDLEDWLVGGTETRIGSSGDKAFSSDDFDGDLAAAFDAALAMNTETQIKAQAGQMAELKDEIRALNKTLIRFGGGE